MPSSLNPFLFGDPVRGEHFLDRRRELRRLVSQVRNGGSALVTAEPRMGKTSLLMRLREQAEALFGQEMAGKMVFHYLDGQTMSGWDAERFWQEAFRPLAKRWKAARTVYETGRFDAVAWEPVFAALEKQQRHFVLLLDEFDAVQAEPELHTKAVYGMLRSLASRHTSFSVVLASRRALTDLNHAARDFASGSPFFNFTQAITLSPLPERYVKELLQRGAARFDPEDRAFLRRVAGQHPYFLQAAAALLWEAYEDGGETAARHQRAGQEFFAVAGESVLQDIWASWPPYMQMAFTLAALDSLPHLLPGREFDLQALLRDLPDFSPELRKLTRRGFLREDPRLQSGHTPQAEVMLWYLSEELTRALRDESSLQDWLGRQQWEGLLKVGEKKAMTKLLHKAAPLLQEGVTAFINAAAEGAARGMLGTRS